MSMTATSNPPWASKRLVQIADERDHVRAQRFKSLAQIVRKKVFVLDDQDATAGK
jgi:hypothetical protein